MFLGVPIKVISGAEGRDEGKMLEEVFVCLTASSRIRADRE